MFLSGLLYSISDGFKSLEQITNKLFEDYGLKISKQALDERFSSRSTDFIKSLLTTFLQNQVYQSIKSEVLEYFNSVRIIDATIFEIHESLSDLFPGFGGGEKSRNSKAGVSIQYEFDLKSNKIADVHLSAATQKDTKYAQEKLTNLQKRDLIIRDLGYYSSALFEYYLANEIFFISRLHASVKVFLTKDKKSELNFKKLLTQMRISGETSKELEVYIGEKKLKVRLLITLCPEEVAENRIKDKNNKNKRNGRKTSEESKIRAHFNLIITNIPKGICSLETVLLLYRVRWQIELNFKVWKSIMNLEEFRKVKKERMLTMLYTKLLWIFINWNLISQFRNKYYQETKKLLSIYKSFNTLKEMGENIRIAILTSKYKIKQIIQEIETKLQEKHWLEKRKKRHNFIEIFPLIFCSEVKYN